MWIEQLLAGAFIGAALNFRQDAKRGERAGTTGVILCVCLAGIVFWHVWCDRVPLYPFTQVL